MEREAQLNDLVGSYMGRLISVTLKDGNRYMGTVCIINPSNTMFDLRNVIKYGTEGRQVDGPQIPPSKAVFERLVFCANDIIDIVVADAPPVQGTEPVYKHPAIIQSNSQAGSSGSSNLVSAIGGSSTQSYLYTGSSESNVRPSHHSGYQSAIRGCSRLNHSAFPSYDMPTQWQGYSRAPGSSTLGSHPLSVPNFSDYVYPQHLFAASDSLSSSVPTHYSEQIHVPSIDSFSAQSSLPWCSSLSFDSEQGFIESPGSSSLGSQPHSVPNFSDYVYPQHLFATFGTLSSNASPTHYSEQIHVPSIDSFSPQPSVPWGSSLSTDTAEQGFINAPGSSTLDSQPHSFINLSDYVSPAYLHPTSRSLHSNATPTHHSEQLVVPLTDSFNRKLSLRRGSSGSTHSARPSYGMRTQWQEYSRAPNDNIVATDPESSLPAHFQPNSRQDSDSISDTFLAQLPPFPSTNRLSKAGPSVQLYPDHNMSVMSSIPQNVSSAATTTAIQPPDLPLPPDSQKGLLVKAAPPVQTEERIDKGHAIQPHSHALPSGSPISVSAGNGSLIESNLYAESSVSNAAACQSSQHSESHTTHSAMPSCDLPTQPQGNIG